MCTKKVCYDGVGVYNYISLFRRTINNITDDLYNSDDPEIKSKWRSITETGQKPTVEQMIEYLTAKVTSQMNNKHYS